MPLKDPEARRAWSREYARRTKAARLLYKKRHRAWVTEDRLRRKPITKVEEKSNWYLTRWLEQHGGCAICGSLEGKKALAIDHSHITGLRRGLLCQLCNIGIGHFREEPRLLRAAVRYLKQYAS